MPNYNNGKIYKIWSTQTDEIYIGSTTQPLSKRIGGHRRSYKVYKKGKRSYVTSFKILEYGDAKIELIEDCKCERKEQLLAREGHFIRTLDCVNRIMPGRKKKQWYEDNRELLVQKSKQYHEDNKEKRTQKAKQYYQDNKEKVLQRTKQYRKENLDKVRLQKKQYYQKNKYKKLQKITCECGAVVAKTCIARHRKSKKHLNATLEASKHLR